MTPYTLVCVLIEQKSYTDCSSAILICPEAVAVLPSTEANVAKPPNFGARTLLMVPYSPIHRTIVGCCFVRKSSNASMLSRMDRARHTILTIATPATSCIATALCSKSFGRPFVSCHERIMPVSSVVSESISNGWCNKISCSMSMYFGGLSHPRAALYIETRSSSSPSKKPPSLMLLQVTIVGIGDCFSNEGNSCMASFVSIPSTRISRRSAPLRFSGTAPCAEAIINVMRE